MASKFNYWVTAALGMAVATGGAWWLQSKPQGPKEVAAVGKTQTAGAAAPRVAGVEVVKVAAEALRDDAQAVGNLRARQSVMLRPELVGTSPR